MNETIQKFGYPRTLIAEYSHWLVLFREKQVTAGCLVLACKQDASAFSDISADAFGELKTVIGAIETNLARLVEFEKINYLMLMMVDRHVHFHVIPRHAEPRVIAGVAFKDTAWPKPPDLAATTVMSDEELVRVRTFLAESWSR